jgi:two-component system, NarL family, nitrate/nitrite response regulator NarL
MGITMANVRLLVIASDPLARAGLASLMENQPGFEVVGRAAGDTQLLSDLDLYQPDAAMWDLGWDSAPATPQDAGLLADLLDAQLPILMLIAEPDSAPTLWAAGAHGILLRDSSAEEMAAALQALLMNLVVLDPALAQSLLPAAHHFEQTPLEAITPREMEVLHLLAEGHANKTIAQLLSISEHTVKFHVNALMGKLNAQSRTEVVVRATRQGLITL